MANLEYTATTDFNADGEFSECEVDMAWASLQVKALLSESSTNTITINENNFTVTNDDTFLLAVKAQHALNVTGSVAQSDCGDVSSLPLIIAPKNMPICRYSFYSEDPHSARIEDLSGRGNHLTLHNSDLDKRAGRGTFRELDGRQGMVIHHGDMYGEVSNVNYSGIQSFAVSFFARHFSNKKSLSVVTLEGTSPSERIVINISSRWVKAYNEASVTDEQGQVGKAGSLWGTDKSTMGVDPSKEWCHYCVQFIKAYNVSKGYSTRFYINGAEKRRFGSRMLTFTDVQKISFGTPEPAWASVNGGAVISDFTLFPLDTPGEVLSTQDITALSNGTYTY